MSQPDEPRLPVSALPDIASSTKDTRETISFNAMDGEQSKEDGDASPTLAAIPLPSDNIESESDEDWYNLRMSWSGKIYPIKVGANDMWVLSHTLPANLCSQLKPAQQPDFSTFAPSFSL